MLARPTIAYIRETTLLTDAAVQAYVVAQQIQIDRDLEPAWGTGAVCVFVPKGGAIPPDAWEFHLVDNPSEPDELGDHDVTDQGLPRARIAIAGDIANSTSWTVTASHETCETLVDPMGNQVVRIVSANGETLEYAKEVCDASEDDQFGYRINGPLMSDFALPAYFDPNAPGPYTFGNHVAAPLTLAIGGYIGVHEVAPRLLPWGQRFAAGPPGVRAINKRWDSRTMRRFARGPVAVASPVAASGGHGGGDKMTDEPEMVWIELLRDGMDMKAGDKLRMPKEFADGLIAEGAAEICPAPPP